MFRVLSIAGLLAAGPALAQSDDGWIMERDARQGVVVASALYDSGLGLAVRCQNHQLQTVVFGLPAAPVPTGEREGSLFEAALPNGDVHGRWRASPDWGSAVLAENARFVRGLKAGGAVTIRARSNGDRPIARATLDLPTDGGGLDEVLTACGRDLVDERDQRPDVSEWVGVGRGHLGLRPGDSSLTRLAFGYSCIVGRDDTVQDCKVEYTHPRSEAVAERLRRSAGRARFLFQETTEPLAGGIFYVNLEQVVTREVIQ